MIKAMIFAAGLGTRLAPITDSIPKALVPVGGTPMLGRVIDKLRNAGITEIVVNVHHFADKIRNYLQTNGHFGVNIVVSDETERLLDTGGALVHAWHLLRDADAVLIHNADILTDFPVAEMIAEHMDRTSDATLLVSDRSSSRLLYFNPDTHRLVGWQNTKTGATLPCDFNPSTNSPTPQPRAFGGVHLLSRSALEGLQRYALHSPEVFSIIPYYIDSCNTLNIRAYTPRMPYMWHDIGSLDKLRVANYAFSHGS